MIEIIAYLTMVIDHIWAIFFPSEMIFRYIWRISFPLFAYWLVRGYRNTKKLEKYFIRLSIFSLVSQIPYEFAFDTKILNIWFTLLVWILLLMIYDINFKMLKNKILSFILKLILITFFCYFAEKLNIVYGTYWVLSILVIHIFYEKYYLIPAYLLLNMIFYEKIQFYSILWVLVLFIPKINSVKINLPRYFKYWFYPVHLAVFVIIKYFL